MEAHVSTNEVNSFSTSELNYIRDTIESMNKFNQIEILRIMNKHYDITLNENKYGVHINLSDLKKEMIEELSTYIKYVNTQEIALHQVEKQKESFKNIYFGKDNKDK
jgi:thiamine monophosphate synthase